MTKQRSEYIYRLIGVITKKKKFLPKEGKYLGTYYYGLAVEIEHKPEIISINVFPDRLENKTILESIENEQYLGKRYLLRCKNWRGHYYLIDWEERGNSSQENKENHGNN